mgnify:CR=1 FL=1
MKVLLLQDVAKIGKKGEVKEVPQGYANNFLLPRKLASVATNAIIQQQKKLQEQSQQQAKKQEAKIDELFKILHKKEITLQEKANEKGHLFSTIQEKDMVVAIKYQLNIHIQPEFLQLPTIKEIGSFDVDIVHTNKKAKITVVIT